MLVWATVAHGLAATPVNAAPTLADPYPILAAGRPYIAAVEPLTEVAALTDHHRCGVLVTPGDAAELASAVIALADDRHAREAMGQRARAASELFARDRQVAAHAQVLRQVAAGA